LSWTYLLYRPDPVFEAQYASFALERHENCLNNSNEKAAHNATKAGEIRCLDATIMKKGGRSQGDLTAQAPLEQPKIWGVSHQENILTSKEEKF